MNLKYKNDSNTNHDFTLIDFYKLLRIYDLKSFTELKSESPKIVDFNFFISQSISHDSDIKLFRELLVIFPYYFFANISITERDSIKNLINGNKKFKNHEELTKLFDFDFDVTTLIESLDELKKHGYQFNYPKIVTDLYITLLEYAFLILCKTIKIKAFNTVFEMVEEFSKTVKISGHIAKDKLFLEYYNNAICDENENSENYFKNIKLFSNINHFSKILFSKIFFNLNGSKSDLSTKERNKALRPIFIKLILKPIFQESYHLGEDDPKVVRKLNDTIKYLESIPYKKN